MSGVYGKECDIWSLGVVIFQFLSGDFPFSGDDLPEIFENIKRGEFECDKDMISDDAEDLIRKMLVLNPDKRITALKALDHPWIKQSERSGLKRKGTFKQLDMEHSNEMIQNL